MTGNLSWKWTQYTQVTGASNIDRWISRPGYVGTKAQKACL